jgi:hypothetical protein
MPVAWQLLPGAAIVFGKSSGSAIDLSAIANGSGGFVINGQCAGDYSGRSVAAAGDINGDGLADLVVGAPYGDPAAGSNAGRSYVIFGKTGSAAIRPLGDRRRQRRLRHQRPVAPTTGVAGRLPAPATSTVTVWPT